MKKKNVASNLTRSEAPIQTRKYQGWKRHKSNIGYEFPKMYQIIQMKIGFITSVK